MMKGKKINNMNVDLHWNEDHTAYAVLVSYGFGAGWSTWNEWPELAYDKRVVEWFMFNIAGNSDKWCEALHSSKENEYEAAALEFLHSIGYKGYICLLGLADCEIEWIYSGESWRIEEYDGAEMLKRHKDYNWNCF